MSEIGNQTLIKTETGIWSVQHNAENRPVRWTRGTKVITMAFDRLGRRQYGKTATFLMHDGNKNVTDVVTVDPANTPVAHYDYAPFGAWEKGAIERHNRLLRTYHPKSTDFAKFIPYAINKTLQLLIHYPRKAS